VTNDFWDALTHTNPLVLIFCVIGFIGLFVYLVDLYHKVKAELGFQTKTELKDKATEMIRQDHECQLVELKNGMKEINTKLEALTQVNVMILGDKISQKCRYYIKLGYIPLKEYSYFKCMYEAYKSIHGNHGIDDEYNYCIENLDVKDDYEQIILK
jgi:hypothetical protein